MLKQHINYSLSLPFLKVLSICHIWTEIRWTDIFHDKLPLFFSPTIRGLSKKRDLMNKFMSIRVKMWERGEMSEWMSEWACELMRAGWVAALKRVLSLNGPPHEYRDKQKFLAQRHHTNWIHLSPFAVGETRHSSLRPVALHPSTSPQPPTSDTNTASSHNARESHDNHNNSSAWDKTVCGTPGQLKYLRDSWLEKNKQLWVFLFWELLNKDVCYFCPVFVFKASLKTLHLEESDVCLVTDTKKTRFTCATAEWGARSVQGK